MFFMLDSSKLEMLSSILVNQSQFPEVLSLWTYVLVSGWYSFTESIRNHQLLFLFYSIEKKYKFVNVFVIVFITLA